MIMVQNNSRREQQSRLNVITIKLSWILLLLLSSSKTNLVSGFTITPSLLKSKPTVTANTVDKVRKNSITKLDATWSDSRAVRDYQDFLSSGKQEIELTKDGPSVIIVPFSDAQNGYLNEMANMIVTLGMGDDVVLTPDQMLPDSLGGEVEYPIYITIPPQEISEFIKNLSPNMKERNQDFVFLSGGLSCGNIEDVLKDYGYCRDSMTQFLVTGIGKVGPKYKDVSTKLGTDAMGEEKWAGECAACGKWNGSIFHRLERNNIRCTVDFYRDWRRKMWERSILDAVFHLVGAVRKDEPTTIANVATYYEAEVSDLVWEISGNLRGWKALTLTFGFEERLYGVAESSGNELQCTLLPDMYPYIWGNRVYTDGKLFTEYLWYAQQECGLLPTIELPKQRSDGEEVKSIMRKGNLRADGVV